jgi:hypothetical protein
MAMKKNNRPKQTFYSHDISDDDIDDIFFDANFFKTLKTKFKKNKNEEKNKTK